MDQWCFRLAFVSLFFLASCQTTGPLAPKPPEFNTMKSVRATQSNSMSHRQMEIAQSSLYQKQNPESAEFNQNALNNIEPAAGVGYVNLSSVGHNSVAQKNAANPVLYESQGSFYDRITDKKGCRLHERFDNKTLLAYKWENNHLSLDVDGINMSSTELEQIKFKYRMRLNPSKKQKRSCLYKSSWQGLLGSGYNEFVRRKDETVYEGVNKIRSEVMDYIQQ